MRVSIYKIPISFLSIFLFSHGISLAQDSTTILVGKIREEYQKINSEKLKKVEVEAKNESSEGGEVYRYYAGDTLRKITSEYMGHMGRANGEYYFKDGKLLFVFIVYSYYDTYMSGKIVRREENRYYFHNGHLIRWIDEHGKIKDKSLYDKKAKEILDDEDLK